MFKRTLLALMVFSHTTLAQETVDFSKAYISFDTQTPEKAIIAGIKARSGDKTEFGYLQLSFNSKLQNFEITPKLAWQSLPNSSLEQKMLLGTAWKGDYKSSTNVYVTELVIKSVQNGFLAGEITHKTADPKSSLILKAEVAGNISTEYLIDESFTKSGAKEGVTIWVSAAQFAEIVAGINEKNEKLKPEDVLPLPDVKKTRQIIHLKRIRALEFASPAGANSWGSHTEYRLVLEDEVLSGSVGTPTDRYGNSDELTGVGSIELKSVSSLDKPAPAFE